MNVLNPAIFENLVTLRTKRQEKKDEPFVFLYHWQDLATISGICFELDQDILLKYDYMDLLLKGASKRPCKLNCYFSKHLSVSVECS